MGGWRESGSGVERKRWEKVKGKKVEGGDEDFREGAKKDGGGTLNCISAAFSGGGARARLVKVETF
jgi:hypothetical protein